MKRINCYISIAIITLAITSTFADEDNPSITERIAGKDAYLEISPVERLKKVPVNSFDTEFLNEMIQHHRDGMEMAGIARSKATSDRLKNFAREMEQKQSAQVDQMAHILQSSYDQKPRPASAHNRAMHRRMAEMKSLQSFQGAAFDEQFIEMAAEHHDEGVHMTQQAIDRGKSNPVRQMAQQINNDQRSDLQRLKALKKSELPSVPD